MKRFESRTVTPFEKFALDSDKAKLAIRLPLRVTETPLLLYIEFGKNSERFCLGEEKAVRQIAEDPNHLMKHKGAVLMLSEERPFGSLLMDSYAFILDSLPKVTNIFRSMLHSIDGGNSERASDYKMLEKLWSEGSPFQ